MSTKSSNEVNVAEKKKIAKPKKFNVVLLNDDVTPMQFVVQILKTIFHHDDTTATQIMLAVHEKGREIAGTYGFEIAEQKASDVHTWAQNEGFPLRVKVEPV